MIPFVITVVLLAVFEMESPASWIVILCSFAFYLILAGIVLGIKIQMRANFYNNRQENLQKMVDSNLIALCKQKRVRIKVGEYGLYLKFVFTVCSCF